MFCPSILIKIQIISGWLRRVYNPSELPFKAKIGAYCLILSSFLSSDISKGHFSVALAFLFNTVAITLDPYLVMFHIKQTELNWAKYRGPRA